jgi:hypothetical protein
VASLKPEKDLMAVLRSSQPHVSYPSYDVQGWVEVNERGVLSRECSNNLADSESLRGMQVNLDNG